MPKVSHKTKHISFIKLIDDGEKASLHDDETVPEDNEILLRKRVEAYKKDKAIIQNIRPDILLGKFGSKSIKDFLSLSENTIYIGRQILKDKSQLQKEIWNQERLQFDRYIFITHFDIDLKGSKLQNPWGYKKCKFAFEAESVEYSLRQGFSYSLNSL